jgi:hypothetical protein
MRPRLRLAITEGDGSSTASLSRWTHRVGVTGSTRGDDTPTWAAIELSSPVAFADRLEMGELSSWQPFLPPHA